jgi:hypothetical protein
MTLVDFVHQIPNFDRLPPREKMKLFAWHLHAHGGRETFDNAAMRDCFQQLAIQPPEIAKYLGRMADATPAELVRVRGDYKLEGSVRRAMDAKYKHDHSTVVVSRLLADLPAQIPNLAEREFLVEAINCYRMKAYRATIVMVWSLAFDHFLNWLLADAKRLTHFNAALAGRFPKKPPPPMTKRGDFEDHKESDIIETSRIANLLPKSQIDTLRDRLKRRNIAAHPSNVVIGQAQADDTVTDLVNNIVRTLR